jgi:hypothetical protein
MSVGKTHVVPKQIRTIAKRPGISKYSKHLQNAMVPKRGHLLDSNGGPTIKEHKFYYSKG